MTRIDGIGAVLLDIGGTLVAEAPPLTPVDALVAHPLPDVLETLQALAHDHLLAAVSDTAIMDEIAVRKLLAPVGIDSLLLAVVTSRDVGAAKPSPAGLEEALRRLGVPAERALFVGDRDVDRDAARAAGVRFVAVDRGFPDAIERARLATRGAFAEAAARVRPLDAEALAAARARQDQLTKPVGALGRLESLGIQLSGLAGLCPPPVASRPAVAVFAGDHGVVAEGVTPWPQDITAQMVANFVAGGAAINVLARQVGAAVHVVDVGVATSLDHLDGVHHRKVREGTNDLARGPAMRSADALAALDVGAQMAAQLVDEGHDLLVTGEMGIGNTTPTAALIAACTAHPAAQVTGRGTGIDDAMLRRKIDVVAAASARTSGYLDPVSVLSEVGGLEIAAIAGYMVAGAAARVPVVVDGVIACAALLVADALAPGVRNLVIAGHRSSEPGATVALRHLGLTPLLDLDLRLGEGTGACLAVPVVQAAARILGEMATFDDL
jgi:nicotinate-nucleotide--dimethylbenzimidazole phosphoribosyltransferase